MKRFLYNTIKFIIVFVCMTSLFYVSLRYFHSEYEQQRIYDEPDGRAVKVMKHVDDWVDRMYIFIRTGE